MYDIITIIYGVPYTKEIELAANRAEGYSDDEVEEFDYLYLSDYGFEFEYTGHVVDITPGFLGIVLDSFASWEVDVEKIKNLDPTEEEKQEVQTMIDNLPEWLRDALPEVKIYTINSTS